MTESAVRAPAGVYRTKREIAYHAIREAIQAGRLAAGQRLIISLLARELDLSDVPVREAFVQLEAEGLLDNTPHVGATVTELRAEDVLDVYMISSVLEGAAVAWVTPDLTSADFERLEARLATMDAAVASGDLEAFARQDAAFHRLICARCPSARLVELIEQLWGTKERLRTAFPVRSRGAATQREHRAIVAALRARDAPQAERLMRDHLAGSGRNRALELRPDPRPESNP
jgi:DNA-binding GntR family transcriptional regulator